MLGVNHFYHRTIRKIVVAFGTIFNDIQLVRYTKDLSEEKERFRIPLSYGSKEKYLTRINSDPDLQKSIQIAVPRISFEMTGMSYDSSRKQISTLRNFAKGSTISTLRSQYVPIPYNFDFSLSIFVRNTEDGTQILEQILPFFTPDFNLTVNFIPELQQKYDVPIILNSVNSQVEYEGDMSSTRLITWDLEFTVKAYIWPAVTAAALIRSANTNIRMSEDPLNSSANSYIVSAIVTRPNPITAEIDDEFGFSEESNNPNAELNYIIYTEDGFELVTEDSKGITLERFTDLIDTTLTGPPT
jgi:hypothetical protein